MPRRLTVEEACLMTNVSHAEATHGPESTQARDAIEIPCTCLLRKGHRGAHQWTWDGDAIVNVTAHGDLEITPREETR